MIIVLAIMFAPLLIAIGCIILEIALDVGAIALIALVGFGALFFVAWLIGYDNFWAIVGICGLVGVVGFMCWIAYGEIKQLVIFCRNWGENKYTIIGCIVFTLILISVGLIKHSN